MLGVGEDSLLWRVSSHCIKICLKKDKILSYKYYENPNTVFCVSSCGWQTKVVYEEPIYPCIFWRGNLINVRENTVGDDDDVIAFFHYLKKKMRWILINVRSCVIFK